MRIRRPPQLRFRALRPTWSQRTNGNRAISAPPAMVFGMARVGGNMRRLPGPFGHPGRVGLALPPQNRGTGGGGADFVGAEVRALLVLFARKWRLSIGCDGYPHLARWNWCWCSSLGLVAQGGPLRSKLGSVSPCWEPFDVELLLGVVPAVLEPAVGAAVSPYQW